MIFGALSFPILLLLAESFQLVFDGNCHLSSLLLVSHVTRLQTNTHIVYTQLHIYTGLVTT